MKTKFTSRLMRIPAYVLLLFTTIISLTPFYIMFIMGTYKNEDIFKGLKFFPGTYILENFKTILQGNVIRPYFNSLFISVCSMAVCVFVSAMIGYGMAKFQFKGKKLLMTILLATLVMPYQISLAGYMMEMRWAHLNGTLLPMILVFVANPFGAFWMTQYIGASVPDSIVESARIDGCGEFRLFINIVLPVIKPATITLALLVFLWSWNNFLIPLVFVTDPAQYTLPLFISTLGGSYRVDYAAKMLNLTIATIPVLIFFSIFSKYLIKGMTIGAVKE
ncbi:MAG: carbohydrate ABC transporter permease [Eubacteriales bacterium]|nr:carbohydrate ABC transporter permease [Eubacteriales bacterium]